MRTTRQTLDSASLNQPGKPPLTVLDKAAPHGPVRVLDKAAPHGLLGQNGTYRACPPVRTPFAWLAQTTQPSKARGPLLETLENLPERYQGHAALLGPPAPGAYRGLLRDLPGGVLVLSQSVRTLEYFVYLAAKAGRKVWTQHEPGLGHEPRLTPLPGVAILRGPELELPGARADEKALCAQLAERGLAALAVPCTSTRPPPKRTGGEAREVPSSPRRLGGAALSKKRAGGLAREEPLRTRRPIGGPPREASRRSGPSGAVQTKTPEGAVLLKRPSPSGAVVGPRQTVAQLGQDADRPVRCRFVQDADRPVRCRFVQDADRPDRCRFVQDTAVLLKTQKDEHFTKNSTKRSRSAL